MIIGGGWINLAVLCRPTPAGTIENYKKTGRLSRPVNPKLTRKRLINRMTSLLCFSVPVSLSRKRFDVSALAAVKVSLPLTRKFGNLGSNFVRSCLRPV